MTTVAEHVNDNAVKAQTVLKRSVCLMLTCGYLGNSRKVDPAQLKMSKDEHTLTDREKRQVRMSKQLVDARQLTACNKEIESAKAYLKARSCALGYKVFGAGTYLIPITSLSEVIAELKVRQARVAVSARQLADRWESIVEQRCEDLGPLFNAKEYATKDDVIAAYKLDWSYMSFSAPENLMEVDKAAYDEAVLKNEQKVADAFDEVIIQMRASALTVMRELVKRLSPGDDGKKKSIHATALRDLNEYIKSLPKRNIGGDDELDQVVKFMADSSDGIDVEMLKKSDAVRNQLHAAAEQAVEQLEKMVENVSTRAISFGGLSAA